MGGRGSITSAGRGVETRSVEAGVGFAEGFGRGGSVIGDAVKLPRIRVGAVGADSLACLGAVRLAVLKKS